MNSKELRVLVGRITPIYNIFIFYCAYIDTNLYSFGQVVKNGCYAANITPTFQNDYIQHSS